MKIGEFIKQPEGHKAFVPDKFPFEEKIVVSPLTEILHSRATLAVGKLDGITQLLPDLDHFLNRQTLIFTNRMFAKWLPIQYSNH